VSKKVGDDLVLAVDIGGTKMAVALIGRRGSLEWRSAAPTPAGAGADELWATLSGLIAAATGRGTPVACGVGCGGPMEPGGETVSPLNIAGWRRFPLRPRLAELTGLPVWVDNDAKALARGEGWVGAAAGRRNYLSMVVSTGVGGGIVVDGRLLDGGSGNAGHIGHVIVVPGGRKCACGAYGCLEAEASGTAIAAITGRSAAEAGPDVIERTGRLVGRAVGNVANLLDLGLATVAGSVAFGFGEPFFASARAELDLTARLDFSAGCRIEPSPLGPDGPLLGAAAVGWAGLDSDFEPRALAG
jgi:glucokinase